MWEKGIANSVIIRELEEFGANIDTYDPWANAAEVNDEYGINLISHEQLSAHEAYDAVVLAVAHDRFKDFDIKKLKKQNTIIYDVKGVLPLEIVDERL